MTREEKKDKEQETHRKKHAYQSTIGWLVTKSLPYGLKSLKEGRSNNKPWHNRKGVWMMGRTDESPNVSFIPLNYRKSSARARFLPRDSSCGAGGPSPGSEQKYLG